MAKYHLEDTRELSLAHDKERLNLVEQKIEDEITPNGETANKAHGKAKGGRLCFHCDKLGHIKVKCYEWLATEEGKDYAKTLSNEDGKADNEAMQANQNDRQRSRRLAAKPLLRRKNLETRAQSNKTAKTTIPRMRGLPEK